MNRRDFLVRTGALAGGMLAAACGTNIGGGGGASGGGTSGGGGGKVTLTHWYHQYGEQGTQQAVERYAQEYTKQNPKVQINVVWVPGDYGTKLSAALVGPNPPDVYETSPTLQMVKQNQAVRLDDLFSDADKRDFYPNVMQTNTINGHIYGVKMVTDVGLLYYRKSLLQRAGVQPPQSAADVVAAARTLTQGHTKGMFVGNDGGIGALEVLLPQSNRVSFLSGGDTVGFATQQTAEALQPLIQLNANGSLLVGNTTDWFQPDAINQNLVAMQWTGLWAMKEVRAAIGDDFDVLPWPAFSSGGTPVTFIGGWSAIVNGHSNHVAEAKKYVKWLWIDNKDIQKDFNLSYGFHIPPRKSIAAKATPLHSGPAKKAVDILGKYGLALPPTWDATMGTAYGDAVSAIVKDRHDATSSLPLLKGAQQKAQQELDQELK